jgi:hypothetical protein
MLFQCVNFHVDVCGTLYAMTKKWHNILMANLTYKKTYRLRTNTYVILV